MENITAPRISSATTLSSVCETSVPITTGSASRGRPSRRATISARDGSPSRAGSVADISTPTAVPCHASVKRGRDSGSAALRIACHETARKIIETHISASPTSTQVGLDVTSVCADAVDADPLQRQIRAAGGAERRERDRAAAQQRAGAARGRRRRLQRRQPPRGPARPEVGRAQADPHSGALGAPLGLRDRARVLVGVDDLRGDLRPGVALGARARGGAQRRGALRRQRQVAQRLGERRGVAARHEQAVDAVADDVAIAGDVGGDDGRAGREALGQDHAEGLAAQRRCGEHVGALERRALLGVGHAAEHGHAGAVDQQRQRPRTRRRRRSSAAPARGRAAPRTRAAGSAGPCARAPGRRRRSPAARPGARSARGGRAAGGQLDAVRHDPVLAAVEAPAGPGGGFGHRDPHGEPVELAPRAHQVGDGVRQRALRVAVEGADQRRVGRRSACPSRSSARPARARARRRTARRAARAAAWRPPRASRPGSRRRRSTASRSCRPAAPATRARCAAAVARRGAARRCRGRPRRRARARARRARRRAARRPAPRCGAAPRRGTSTSMGRPGRPASGAHAKGAERRLRFGHPHLCRP